jgi:glycosyltransferase involved in cell wall biosynthesis
MNAPDAMVTDPSTVYTGNEGKRPVILQILPRLETGGVERGTVDIAAAISAQGWVSLVASAGGPMVRELERAGAEHIILPVHSKNPFTIRKNVDRIAMLVEQRAVDIVHARSRAPAWSARAAARRTGAHFVTTFHGTYSAGSAVKRWYNSIMSQGDRVIAISQFIADEMIHTYGVEPERLRIIPRGIDFHIFDPAAVSAERMIMLAKQWRVPDDSPVVMLPGRLTGWKGQSFLIDALARLRRRDIRCILVGTDKRRERYRRRLERQIEKCGLSGVVQLVGECRDMAAAYLLADVVVSPSTKPEAFGRVAAEGQAMGKPVIATDHGGARETVAIGETGWLVPTGDVQAFADALEQALSMSSAEREVVSRRAIARVRELFSKERMCAQTLDVYREILAERAALPG